MNDHRRFDAETFPPWRAAAVRSFREAMFEQRYDSHVKPINCLADRLSASGRWVPYLAPTYGGVMAEVLFLFQDPGPATAREEGSGFLCHQNDDPSAELFARCLLDAGLAVERVATWNAYPWFRSNQRSGPTLRQIDEGMAPLIEFLGLLPRLRVALLMGAVAGRSWERLALRHPEAMRPPGGLKFWVRGSLHTSGRGITNGGQHSRAEGVERVVADMAWAREICDLE